MIKKKSYNRHTSKIIVKQSLRLQVIRFSRYKLIRCRRTRRLSLYLSSNMRSARSGACARNRINLYLENRMNAISNFV